MKTSVWTLIVPLVMLLAVVVIFPLAAIGSLNILFPVLKIPLNGATWLSMLVILLLFAPGSFGGREKK